MISKKELIFSALGRLKTPTILAELSEATGISRATVGKWVQVAAAKNKVCLKETNSATIIFPKVDQK